MTVKGIVRTKGSFPPMTRLKAIWHILNLPCREMTRLASESLDRDLGRLERVVLKSHLLYCMSCRRYLRHVLFLRCALRQVAKHVETGEFLPVPACRTTSAPGSSRHSGKTDPATGCDFATAPCQESPP